MRFAARKSGDADRVAQSKSLQQFGIVIDLAALPEPGVEIEAVAPGRLRLRRRGQAVGAGSRARGTPDSPAAGRSFGRGFPSDRIRDRSAIRLRLQVGRSRPVDLAIEADAHRLEIQRRADIASPMGSGRRRVRTGCRDIPARTLQCGAKAYSTPAPATQPGRMLICLSSLPPAGVLRKRSPGPGEPAGDVGEPRPAGIADAAARGPEIIPSLLDDSERGVANRRRRREFVGEIIRKGEIGFDAEQQPGWTVDTL